MASQPYVGEIFLVPYNFAPAGFAFCQGQLMAISQNNALFALIGTTYGGDGQTTFALPDLRSRIVIGTGQGPNLSSYVLGQSVGSETVTLQTSQIPQHDHAVPISTAARTTSSPVNAVPAGGGAYGSPVDTSMQDSAGGGQPHDNVQPFTTLNYVISLFGIFPSRN
jgi:microcystin-dependent protein